jgi:Fur family ferric uptake transcriptional regulator
MDGCRGGIHCFLSIFKHFQASRVGGVRIGAASAVSSGERGLTSVRTGSMAVEGIKDSLKQRGVRLTRQRQILLELIDKSGQHLDAERLYLMAKEQDPKLNRVTVYRTLKMLKEGGLVDELDLMHIGGDQHYYETRMKQEHAHIICLRCGKVEEFFGEPLQKLRKQVEAHFGFQVVLARTEVGGYCSHCQVLRAQELREADKMAASVGAETRATRSHRGS